MQQKDLIKKDFILLMLGKFISLIGTRMQSFALSLYVLKITGSAVKFASVLAVMTIPQLILSPIAGVFVDWFNRKKIIVFCDFIRGVFIGGYALVYFVKGSLTLMDIYILVIFVSINSIIFQPAINTVIPSIVKKESIVKANSVNTLIRTIGNLISPLLAGMLMEIFTIGVILLVNSISFIISAISEIFISIPKRNKIPKNISFKVFKKDLFEGMNFVKNKKLIRTIILLALIINFAYNPIFTVGMVYVSKEVLLLKDGEYGLLQSILVIAMLFAPVLCGYLSKKMKLGVLMFVDVFVVSIMVLMFSIVPSNVFMMTFGKGFAFVSMATILFIIVLTITIGNIALNSLIQKEVPIDKMGRVGTVISTTCTAIVPLGQLIFGYLYDNISASICIIISGVILLITILIFRKSLCNKEDAVEGEYTLGI